MKKRRKNKKIIVPLDSLVAVISISSGVLWTMNQRTENYKNMPLKIKSDFTYTAHTGCVGTPDNSLEAIEVGVANGARIVEFDVQLKLNLFLHKYISDHYLPLNALHAV